MNVLLIIWLCTSVVGKIHGQETVVSYVINAQSARISPFDHRPAVIQDINRQLESLPPTRVIEIFVQPAEVELYRPQLFHGSGFNLPQSTVTPNQAHRTHLVSQRITEDMERTNNSDVNRADNSSTTTDNSVIKDMELNKDKPKVKVARPDSLPLHTANVTSAKSTLAKELPPTNVTFDERSSFTGDQCPTGYVKVNGKCVESQ